MAYVQSQQSIAVPSTFKYASAALFYAGVSIATTFFNKAVLSYYDFTYPNFILLAQHIFTIIFLEVFKTLGILTYPKPEMKKCKELLPISLLYSINVGVALRSLEKLNIPVYGVLKRLTILVVLVGERVVMKKHSSTSVKQAVFVIVAGAIITGIGDLTFDFMSYLMAFISCFAQAAYLIWVAKTGAETGINNFGLLFYNSLLAIPFVTIAVLLNDELPGVTSYPDRFDFNFQVCFFFNLLLGCLLNYSMFLCTTVNSPLTTTIMGQLKNILSVILGIFILGGMEMNSVNMFGLTLNSIGGVFYSYVKYKESLLKNKLPI